MREKPIIFSSEMVRAILDGRKTQTRRVIKPQPIPLNEYSLWTWIRGDYWYKSFAQEDWLDGENPTKLLMRHCPYGKPGDKLWVREAWALRGDGKQIMHKEGYENLIKALELPEFGIKWRPSIHMPRWVSRIDLEITEVRVERLQEITSNDCQDEGLPHPLPQGDTTHYIKAYINSFRQLWDSLNAKRGYGWDTNPWVWVICFNVEVK